MGLNNVCVVGVGGVGGYFGGLMAHAIAQQQLTEKRVFFIARGEHLAQIQQHGLILNTPEQQGLICMPAIATERIEEVPTPDLYLICVKSYDLDAAVRAISRNIAPETILIPLLNGVDIYERIRAILNTGIVLPACVYIGTHIGRPGVVTQKGGEGAIRFGKSPDAQAFDPTDVLACFQQLKVKYIWNDAPYPDIWSKYIFIAAFGLVTAATGKTLGDIMGDAETTGTVRSIMEEIAAIAGKKGVALPENIVETSLAKGHNFPPETKTSYQRDVETPGKKDEGDLFGGTLLRMGQALGIPTPVTQQVFSNTSVKRF